MDIDLGFVYGDETVLCSFQVGFDLYGNENSKRLGGVIDNVI